ncbi:MAG: uracil-DNA glycosylase family protein [Bacteroidota bacterium]
MHQLLQEISACQICVPHLEMGPRPVVSAHPQSKIAIIGQAPGRIVHLSGKPWDDKSGEKLRAWLGVTDAVFYDPAVFALIPMGFCYPGKGKSGDLPPRKECAPQWHARLFEVMPQLDMCLLIGQYAQQYYLGKKAAGTLTSRVKNYADYLPQYFVLPHPSPRNNIWRAKNAWFEAEVIPVLQQKVAHLLKE